MSAAMSLPTALPPRHGVLPKGTSTAIELHIFAVPDGSSHPSV
jgi:hypothetical protein